MVKKLIPIVLLLIIIAVGAFAYKFYDENGQLVKKISALEVEQQRLSQENQGLHENINSIKQELEVEKSRADQVKGQLDQAEQQRDDYKNKFGDLNDEVKDLKRQLAEKPKVQVVEKRIEVAAPSSDVSGQAPSQAPAGSIDYWADFVRAKAELAVQLEDMSAKLKELKTALSEKEVKNKELAIQIDELEKRKKKLESEGEFKKRTLDIVSRELVNERESRKALTDESADMRKSNVEFKRDLVMANKEKLQLQKNIDELVGKRDTLEKRISEMETIMRQKAIALNDLEDGLSKALHPDVIVNQKSASVELPPIVVKPEANGIKDLRGSVIAVNDKEKFVIVNMGESKGMRPGFQLKVLRGDKEIGTLEVIEVRREISAADVKELASGSEIKEGDTVITK
jgi:chromosome segregation ATPase